jgi:hypothetical protein
VLQSFVLKGQFLDRFGDVGTEDVNVLLERVIFGFEAIVAPFIVELDESFRPRFIRWFDNGWNEAEGFSCDGCDPC